ncbi:hypothetical protein C4J81_03200 [Deltaproteobacteria bacterium Smac51]|nr:hypothetical protein C4J81_03200 [Deltaproteobacteria bacterium Smac51]
MSESKHVHHGPNSLVWGAHPCVDQTGKYKIKPSLIGYEDLLCQLAEYLDDIDQRLGSQSTATEPDHSYEEQWTGRWDRTDPDGPKKIYVKTINSGGLLDNALKTIPHNIDSLKEVIRLYGRAVRGPQTIVLPCPDGTGDASLTVNDGNIRINCRADFTGFTKSQVTIKYTKNE